MNEEESLALRAWKAAYSGEPAGCAPLVVVKECLAEGMDIDARAWPDGGPTALDGALYGDGGPRMDVVRFLLEEGADPNAFGYDDGTMLMAASLLSNVEAVQWLLARGADPNLTHPTTLEGPLHWVTAKGFRKEANATVRLLLDAGADPNAKAAVGVATTVFYRDVTVIGETPLHRAAAYCDGEVLEMLVDAGADPSIKDAHGESPLTWYSRH
ncbi:MAG: ankyrin repeat domain-containing protein, partial [Planctomycetota bacterium]